MGRPKAYVDVERTVIEMRAQGFSILGIARTIGCSEATVDKAIAALKAQGVDVTPPARVPLRSPPRRRRNDRTDGPAQPNMASLAQWTALEAHRLVIARLKPGQTYRDITPDGRISAWLSVVPSAADGAPFDARASRPELFSSSGSPAAMCAGLA
jgi:transposase